MPISIHAPRVGGDLPAHGGSPDIYISIHAPRVGGDEDYTMKKINWNISIHAPRVGGDMHFFATVAPLTKFQSTPPVWGATGSLQA